MGLPCLHCARRSRSRSRCFLGLAQKTLLCSCWRDGVLRCGAAVAPSTAPLAAFRIARDVHRERAAPGRARGCRLFGREQAKRAAAPRLHAAAAHQQGAALGGSAQPHGVAGHMPGHRPLEQRAHTAWSRASARASASSPGPSTRRSWAYARAYAPAAILPVRAVLVGAAPSPPRGPSLQLEFARGSFPRVRVRPSGFSFWASRRLAWASGGGRSARSVAA